MLMLVNLRQTWRVLSVEEGYYAIRFLSLFFFFFSFSVFSASCHKIHANASKIVLHITARDNSMD